MEGIKKLMLGEFLSSLNNYILSFRRWKSVKQINLLNVCLRIHRKTHEMNSITQVPGSPSTSIIPKRSIIVPHLNCWGSLNISLKFAYIQPRTKLIAWNHCHHPINASNYLLQSWLDLTGNLPSHLSRGLHPVCKTSRNVENTEIWWQLWF